VPNSSNSDSRPGAALSAAVSGLVSRMVLLVVAAFAISTVFFLVSPGGNAASRSAAPDVSRLVAATTQAVLPRAPQDPAPQAATDGEVVHPLRPTPVHTAPGGPAFAKVGAEQLGDLWLPVVDRRGGWSQVLLPSRPNGSTGWLRTSSVERRTTAYLVRVHLGSRRLELLHEGDVVGSWAVAVGSPATPTPTGRTFLLGSITDPTQSFSPVIFPLGAHSDTLDSYGGGPGTVAIHGWPDTSVFGAAVSHGCVRVPADALSSISRVPLGTLVLVDEQ